MKKLLQALKIAKLVYQHAELRRILVELVNINYTIADTLIWYLHLTENSMKITTSTFNDPYEVRVVFTLE